MGIQLSILTRKNFVELIEGLSLEQINFIPKGFSNNIIWNFGHIVVSQQVLCYERANVPVKIDTDLLSRYRKGSKPEKFILQKEVDELKKLCFELLDTLEKDVQTSLFNNYETVTVHYGATLGSISDAINFFSLHDGVHFGYAMAIRKALNINKQ